MDFSCYICETLAPIDFINRHHKTPKSLGGQDTKDNLLDLCPGCHQNLHTIARMMRNPKRAAEISTALRQLFPVAKAQSRCIDLAQHILKSQTLAADLNLEEPNKEIQIGLTLSKKYRDLFQLIARDSGMSMAKCARKIIEAHIQRKYPDARL